MRCLLRQLGFNTEGVKNYLPEEAKCNAYSHPEPKRRRNTNKRNTAFFFQIVLSTYELISKYDTGLKPPMLQGLLEPKFYYDLASKFGKIIGEPEFSDHLSKIVIPNE